MAEVAESVSDPADKTADALALRWDEVQAATYSDRVRTRTILDRMAAAVSERMEDLERRRSPAAHGARQHWESGLAELRQAHAALQYQIKELDCATEDTWDEAKIELATAWERVREAYLDLEASRTSS